MAFGIIKVRKQITGATVTRLEMVGNSSYQTGGNTGLLALISGRRIRDHKYIAHI